MGVDSTGQVGYIWDMSEHSAYGAQRADVTDLPTLLTLIEEYYRYDGIPFQTAAVTRGLRDLMDHPALGAAYVLYSEGRVAGYFVLSYGFDLEFGGRQATVTELFIVAPFRRRGLGRFAIGFAEDLLRSQGIGALELQAEADNHEALAFYARCGFVAHSRVPLSKDLRPTESRESTSQL